MLGLSAAKAVPLLAGSGTHQGEGEIGWRDERNIVIREKAACYAGMTSIAAMSIGALALALVDLLVSACIVAGLLLLYSLSIVGFSVYFSKRL